MAKSRLPTLPQIKKWMIEIARQHDIEKQVANTWKHSVVVWRYADQIARIAEKNGYRVDRRLIKVGTHCHDIGRMVSGSLGSKTLKPAIYHLYEGYKIMKQKGYPVLARICITHGGGGGLDRVTNKQHGFIARNFFPRTTEEKIIAYSDAITFYKKGVGAFTPNASGFEKALERFKKYRGKGKRLREVHQFIMKITKGEIQ